MDIQFYFIKYSYSVSSLQPFFENAMTENPNSEKANYFYQVSTAFQLYKQK